jgi:hypothetical protein
MKKLQCLDGLNGGGCGIFIASNHYFSRCCQWAHQIVRWCTGHCVVHCPVSATSADCWGLELLTVEVFYPLAVPDSPVAHQIVWCVLTLQSAQSTVRRSWSLLRCLTGQSGGARDSPMNYNGRASRKPESSQFVRCSAKWKSPIGGE